MYNKLIDPDILIKYPLTNPHNIVKFDKVVININYNPALIEQTSLYKLFDYLSSISINASPKILKAKNSISNFKRRKGIPIGFLFTLRRAQLQNFYLFFIHFLLPYIVRTYENKNKIFKPINNFNSFNIGLNTILGSSFPININFMVNNNDEKSIYYFSYFSFPIYSLKK